MTKALYENKEFDEWLRSRTPANRWGALSGIEWLFGKFIFSQHFGYYLYSPVEPNRNFYQRYGLMLRATDHILTGISIKAHGQDANFIDIRFVFSLGDL